jgi:hypothetical protein
MPLSTNLFNRNVFEHEFAQTFTEEAYNFVDHKVLAFAESEADADFDFTLSDEYDEFLLAQKDDSVKPYMTSERDLESENYLQKYNDGEDLTTLECWRLWNWLKDEHALVP